MFGPIGDSMMKNIGPTAFILGVIISILVGVVNLGDLGTYALLVLGVIVGLLNIQPDEVLKYLVAIIALLFSSAELYQLFTLLPGIGGILSGILQALTVFLATGAAVVSLRVLIELARD